MNQRKLFEILNKNPNLCEIVKRLKILSTEKTKEEIGQIILKMDLPLKYHLFITGYYSELIKFDFYEI